MSPRGLARSVFLLLALLLAAVLVFAACGDEEGTGGTNGRTTPPAGQSPAASPTAATIDVSNVPELQDGKMIVGSDITYAPNEYYEEGTDTPTGMDVDLANAMADVLGIEVEFQQVADFGGIVGDLKSKRYDIIMSSISITPARQAEIDFIAYFGPVGTGILVQTGNPKGFASMEDVCGHKVAAQQGTYQVTQVLGEEGVEGLNDTICKDNPIDMQTFPDNPAAVQELTLGRVDAHLSDDPVAAYTAAQSEGGLIELAVTGFEAAEYGIGVRKDSAALKAVLDQALQRIIDDGTYAQILDKWGQTQFALQ